MISLEIVVNKEVRAMALRANHRLIQMCRRKALVADKTGHYTSRVPIDHDISSLSEWDYVEQRITEYKSLKDGIDAAVAKVDAGRAVNSTELDGLAESFREKESWLVGYGYPGRLERAMYSADTKLTYWFEKFPLVVKLLLVSPV